ARRMTEFAEVEREEIAVQFVRVPDGLPHIRRAWDQLEADVALRGRRFYGAYDPVADDYRACVEVREGDELVPGLESGTLPGGRYVRARLRGDPPCIYERIKPTFDELMRQARPDETRPSGRGHRAEAPLRSWLTSRRCARRRRAIAPPRGACRSARHGRRPHHKPRPDRGGR